MHSFIFCLKPIIIHCSEHHIWYGNLLMKQSFSLNEYTPVLMIQSFLLYFIRLTLN